MLNGRGSVGTDLLTADKKSVVPRWWFSFDLIDPLSGGFNMSPYFINVTILYSHCLIWYIQFSISTHSRGIQTIINRWISHLRWIHILDFLAQLGRLKKIIFCTDLTQFITNVLAWTSCSGPQSTGFFRLWFELTISWPLSWLTHHSYSKHYQT